MRELLAQTWQNLTANRLRTFLTMFGVAWGVAAIVILSATGEGFQRGNQRVLEELGKNIVIIRNGRTSLQAGGQRAGRMIRLTLDDVHALKAKARLLEYVSPELMRTGTEAAWAIAERVTGATVREWLAAQGAEVTPLPDRPNAPARRTAVSWRGLEVSPAGSTRSATTTISSLDQSRNEPDFSQDVQVNVSGTIGDKLNILADWNTKRTFEYENQLKIKYTGYDDEIVQSVEAGNVSLTTPSSFIGSSQALFGVKAKFQTGPLTLTTLASQKKGQIKEVAVSGGAKEQTFEFRPYEYATNNYFVDTSYISTYEPYYQNDPPLVDGERQIIEEKVWVQRQGSKPDENERHPGEAADQIQAWLAPILEAVDADVLVSDDAYAFKKVSDQTGRAHQVCKSHVVRNTEALVDELSALIQTAQDHSLDAIGVSAEQALTDLEIPQNLDPHQAARRPSSNRAIVPALCPGAQTQEIPKTRSCLSTAQSVHGSLEPVASPDFLSYLEGCLVT